MNAEAENKDRAAHRITMESRERMEVRGVTDVISFDEQSVVLDTACGGLSVEGSSLHIHVLSIEQGIVTMDGKIDSVSYYERESAEKDGKNGFFGKLFR